MVKLQNGVTLYEI